MENSELVDEFNVLITFIGSAVFWLVCLHQML